jgi:hypothetical protein
MLWQQLLENCILRAVRTNVSTRQKFVRVVLSPDVDGILATCLLSHWLWEKHRCTTEIIGTYNGRHVRLYNHFRMDELRHAIWIDLDVRFSEVKCAIGQHFLGPLTIRTSSASFNPNCVFQIDSMSDKYPFGTAHLLLFGLVQAESMSPRGLSTAVGKALVAHADSAFWVCRRYRSNAKKWTDRLFDDHPTPPFLQSLLSDQYINENLDGHREFVRRISPHVYNGKTQIDMLPPAWRLCTGNQTCRAQNATVQLRNVGTLGALFSEILQTRPPTTFNPVHAKTVWEGTKLRMEPSKHTEYLESYLQTYNIRSHAITSARVVSMTQGPPLLANHVEDVSFY